MFVTPEYNHSYPAALKRLIDWHYQQWTLKPASVVGYGVHGGHAAIEHLRGVFAELNMVTTRRCVGMAAPWNSIHDDGGFTAPSHVSAMTDAALAELVWWVGVLRDARARGTFPG